MLRDPDRKGGGRYDAPPDPFAWPPGSTRGEDLAARARSALVSPRLAGGLGGKRARRVNSIAKGRLLRRTVRIRRARRSMPEKRANRTIARASPRHARRLRRARATRREASLALERRRHRGGLCRARILPVEIVLQETQDARPRASCSVVLATRRPRSLRRDRWWCSPIRAARRLRALSEARTVPGTTSAGAGAGP